MPVLGGTYGAWNHPHSYYKHDTPPECEKHEPSKLRIFEVIDSPQIYFLRLQRSHVFIGKMHPRY